jgi:hypothetical protein
MKYQQYYTYHHAQDDNFFMGSGKLFKSHANKMKTLIEMTGSSTLLDYGSGKGFQYSTLNTDSYWNVSVDCYDFAIPEFKTLQDKKYDGVLCMDMLDLVPEEEIDQVLTDIFSRATKFVYIVIRNWPSKKVFEDGNSISVNMNSKEWWDNKISQHNINNIIVGGGSMLVSAYPTELDLGPLKTIAIE